MSLDYIDAKGLTDVLSELSNLKGEYLSEPQAMKLLRVVLDMFERVEHHKGEFENDPEGIGLLLSSKYEDVIEKIKESIDIIERT